MMVNGRDLYSVTATLVIPTWPGYIIRQLPTFLLNKHTQGIVNEKHAAQIARDIVQVPEGAELNLCVVQL